MSCASLVRIKKHCAMLRHDISSSGAASSCAQGTPLQAHGQRAAGQGALGGASPLPPGEELLQAAFLGKAQAGSMALQAASAASKVLLITEAKPGPTEAASQAS